MDALLKQNVRLVLKYKDVGGVLLQLNA